MMEVFAPVKPKASCNVTIDISKLKVIVTKVGGPKLVTSFKYNVKSIMLVSVITVKLS